MDDLSTSFSNEPLSSEPGTSCVPYGWFIVCVRDNLPLSILMAVYYYVPFVLALLITIMLLVRRTTTMLLAQFWIVFLAVLNEGILKNIIRQPRPPDSCDCTYVLIPFSSCFFTRINFIVESIGMGCHLDTLWCQWPS